MYSLVAGYSTDTSNWFIAWSEEPDTSQSYEVDIPIGGGSESTYIGFWIEGDSSYFNNWYIDDVELEGLGITEEYSDYVYLESINSGEEMTIGFEDWTPDFLAEETSGQENYIVECSIEMYGDQNPENDIKSNFFTLDYWHDVGVLDITSPETIISPGTYDIEAIITNRLLSL